MGRVVLSTNSRAMTARGGADATAAPEPLYFRSVNVQTLDGALLPKEYVAPARRLLHTPSQAIVSFESFSGDFAFFGVLFMIGSWSSALLAPTRRLATVPPGRLSFEQVTGWP